MSEKISGGCHCGAVRYEAHAEPMYPGHCQCTNCRKVSGSGHASLMKFPTPAVTLSGKTHSYDYKADSGNTVTRHFCPTCGVGVYNTNSGMDGAFFPFASTLDDPSLFRPTMVVYHRSALPWDVLDPALPTFETMPVME